MWSSVPAKMKVEWTFCSHLQSWDSLSSGVTLYLQHTVKGTSSGLCAEPSSEPFQSVRLDLSQVREPWVKAKGKQFEYEDTHI